MGYNTHIVNFGVYHIGEGKIDKSVMAGVIIRAGDMVIDGSVRGRLERLADVLQS